VELHGGTLTANSAGKDRGATFTVTLQTVAPSANDNTPALDSPSDALGNSSTARILFVEDHPDTARIMARVLRSSGYQITSAHSVAAALKAAAIQTFDLLISDIGLPDATGYDLMRELRRRYNMNGIALSGYGMEEDVRKSLDAGFIEHMVKPVNFTQLEAAIGRALPKR
jgi:CheY-like chemotaxis protein